MNSLLLSLSIFYYVLLSFNDGIYAKLRHKILVVSFDGFALHYLQNASRRLPAFERLRAESTYTEAIESVFPSETFPNHFSIATGLYPETHGMVSNIFYDPTEQFLYNAMGYGNDSRPDLDAAKWWSAEPMWVTARRHGFKTGSSCWPGDRAAYEPLNMQATMRRKDFTIDVPFEKRVDEVIDWFTNENLDLIYLYNFQPDATGHKFGTSCVEMEATLKKVDKELAYLLDKLEKADLTMLNFHLIVVSDHGMWNLEREVIFDDYMNTTALFERTTRFGANVPIWVKPEFERQALDAMQKLSAKHEDLFKVYHKDELPEKYHYKASPRIPSIIAVGKVGAYLTATHKFSMKRLKLIAGHGYEPSDHRMKPIFFARGPAFRRNHNATLTTPNMTTLDVYGVVAELIGGLRNHYPSKVNASLDNIEGLFRNDFLAKFDLSSRDQMSSNASRLHGFCLSALAIVAFLIS